MTLALPPGDFTRIAPNSLDPDAIRLRAERSRLEDELEDVARLDGFEIARRRREIRARIWGIGLDLLELRSSRSVDR